MLRTLRIPRRRCPRRIASTLNFELGAGSSYATPVTADTFKHELAEALKAYSNYIVCIDKVPEDCETALRSLVEKAIKAYENRGPHLRRLFEEAPRTLLDGLAAQVGAWARPGKVQNNLQKLAEALGVKG